MKRTALKRQTPLNRISPKQAKAEAKWQALVARLIVERAHGLCEKCGQLPDWRGLTGHHILPRSRGRIDTDENCLIVCGKCHSELHGVKEINR